MNLNTLMLTESTGHKPIPEYCFHPTRKFRFDYAWPVPMVAVEVEGGAWTGKGHSRPSMFVKDMEKYNLAAELGWRVLRYQPADLLKTATLAQIKATLCPK